MAKNKARKKPTAKEIASAVIEINNKVNHSLRMGEELDNVLGLYIDFKGDLPEFNKFLEKKAMEREAKENDSKEDGKADTPNLQGDTDGEGSGSEGVRKEAG